MQTYDFSKLKKCVILDPNGSILMKLCLVNKENMCEEPPNKKWILASDKYSYDAFLLQ